MTGLQKQLLILPRIHSSNQGVYYLIKILAICATGCRGGNTIAAMLRAGFKTGMTFLLNQLLESGDDTEAKESVLMV
jgi:hypothetical protein